MNKLLVAILLLITACTPNVQAQSVTAVPFHFAFGADSRDNYTVLPVLTTKDATLSPVFFAFAGDLCGSFDVNCINNQWKPADKLLPITFATRGNHDNGSVTTWAGLWNFPGIATTIGASNYTALVNNATYSFDYSNAHFSFVDGNGGGSNSWTSAQVTWLDSDLTAAEGRGMQAEFLFVHGPMYGVTSEHGSEAPSASLKAVLNKHPNLIGFHGHEHVTAYTDVTPSREAGINNFPQFTLGRTGAPAYNVVKPVDFSANQNAFADIFVDGQSVTVTIYNQAGQAIFTKTFVEGGATPTPGPTFTASPVPPTRTSTPIPATFTQTNTPPPGATDTFTPIVTASGTAAPSSSLPLRLAFYYPWYPEAWTQGSINPFTHYVPDNGFYNSSDPYIINKHISDMLYSGIQGGIASWWGQGTPTDGRINLLLNAATGTGFKWALYYEPEGQGNPASSVIAADLNYIDAHYARNDNYLHIAGKPVIFSFADAADGCTMADRWKAANHAGFYVVLKVFPGFSSCASQPDNWHQYGPAVATSAQGKHSFTISPGFWLATEAQPRLVRDLNAWNTNIRAMIASKADFQLITTWNEWGEGSSIEQADEWDTAYMDGLHFNGVPQPTATPIPTDTPLVATVTLVPPPTVVTLTDTPAVTVTPTAACETTETTSYIITVCKK